MDIEILNLGRVVGFSAYELAVQQGFEGTLNEWLESLKYVSSDEYKQLVAQVEEAKKQIESTLTSVNLKTEELVNLVTQSLTDIATSKTQALSDIKTLHDSAIRNISSAETTATDNISSALVAALNELSIALSTAKTGISESGSTWKKHIEDSGVLATDSVNDAKTQALEEITAAKDTSSIELAKNQAIEEINKAKDVTAIETAKTEAVKAVKATETAANESINTQKTTSIEEIKTEGNTQVELIKSTMESELSKKLDKNLGTDNGNKVLTTDAEGNIITQKKEDFEGGGTSDYNDLENKPQINGVELKGNKTSSDLKMYTQEEIDYLLNDKMDKPYVPIEITDSATITDALEGNFKIDKIKGNTYQNIETDIVPTPNRPVPINSRKVLANGEYVELRSLKETGNLFDLKYGQLLFGEKIGNVTNNGSAAIIENQYDITANLAVVYLKANTNYCFKSNRAKEPIEGMEESGNDLNMLNVLKGSTPIIQVISGSTFTVNDSGYYYLRLYGTVGCKVSYTSIMLVEGTSAPSTYVAPTVRDYKIVNHDNKTAKIIRNVNQFELPTDFSWNYTNYYPSIIGNVIPKDKKGVYDTRDYSLINYTTEPYFGYSNISGLYLGFSECDTYWKLNNSDEINAFLTRIKEDGKPFLFQYQLATPVEETITYVETDVSEVGYSWQDTTSPSPTIKSEIKGVEEIDILRTGKNIFDVESAKNKDLWEGGNTYRHFTGIYLKPNTTYTLSISKNNMYKDYKAEYNGNFAFYIGETKNAASPNILIGNTSANIGGINNKYTFTTTDKQMYFNLYVKAWNDENMNIVFDELLQNLQIEQGDTATSYEPYQEQHVNITLPQPLYENDIVNGESDDYEYEKQKYVVTGNETFLNDYQTQSGFYGRYFDLENGNGVVIEKIWCNYLSYIQSSWGLPSEGCCQNSRTQIHIKFSNDRLGIADDTPVEEKRTAFANYLKQLYASENPLYVVVKVAKTTQPIPPEDLAKIKSLTTDTGINNIFINGEVKPTIEARYPQDVVSAVNKLQTRLLTLQEEVIKNV